MHNLTLSSSQLSGLPSLQTNFKNEAFAKEYPSISIIPSENFFPKCIVCLQIPEDPVSLCNKTNLTLDERHLFCRKCTANYESPACPLCNDSLTENSNYTEDTQARKSINDMKCNVIAICPKNCGNILLFNQMEIHLKICNGKEVLTDRRLSDKDSSKSITKCPDCKTKLTPKEQKKLAIHTKICPETLVKYKPKNPMFPSLVRHNRLLQIEEYNVQAKSASNFSHSFLTSSKNTLISLPMYEFSSCNNNPKRITFTYADVTVSINKQNLLVITVKENKSFNFPPAPSNEYFNEQVVKENFVPERFRFHNNSGFLPSEINHPDLKYRLSIYAYLSATESVLVCQQAFTYSSIATLNSIYSHNKSDAPQSFIDLKGFFKDDGLSSIYTHKLGKSMIWKIELVESTAIIKK